MVQPWNQWCPATWVSSRALYGGDEVWPRRPGFVRQPGSFLLLRDWTGEAETTQSDSSASPACRFKIRDVFLRVPGAGGDALSSPSPCVNETPGGSLAYSSNLGPSSADQQPGSLSRALQRRRGCSS